MAAEAGAHSLFILFSLVVGAPLLLGVSMQFITIFHTLFEKMDLDSISPDAQQGMMVSISGISITPDFYFMYAVLILGILGFFGSLLIGLMRTGRVIAGFVYVPVFVIAAIVIFMGINFGLGMVFSSMLAGL